METLEYAVPIRVPHMDDRLTRVEDTALESERSQVASKPHVLPSPCLTVVTSFLGLH